MNIYKDLTEGKGKLSVIGLGYVGLPLAVAFSKKIKVIGFDINRTKINTYQMGSDPTNEVGNQEIKAAKIEFTSEENKLKESKFHIIAVPTPIHDDYTPDLSAIINASKIVGRNLTSGAIVVYESTVYPGVTEDICIPILENESGLKCGNDFKVGYSPERINPGDKLHRIDNIVKIVSAIDSEALDIVGNVYGLIVDAGVYRASSIKVAEAAKVIENSQRDINIAFMNELSIIFHQMDIDTKEVIEAAGTKWNFLKFQPGIVGGHCIGVDPYYLTYKAKMLGCFPQIILSGRRVNEAMGKYIAENIVKHMIKAGINIKESNVVILGFTFKENCPDIRNTKVIDIVKELEDYGVKVTVTDPYADIKEAEMMYKVRIQLIDKCRMADGVIVAVAHKDYQLLEINKILELYRPDINKKILFDIKGIYDKSDFMVDNFDYWRL